MKITYDKSCNMGYVYLKDPIEPGEASKKNGAIQVEINKELPDNSKLHLIFDIDKDGAILGIEVFNAKRRLHNSVIENLNQTNGADDE